MAKVAKIVKISRISYYEWIKGIRSKREIEDEKIKKIIMEIYYESHKIYGRPRIYHALKKKGIKISEMKVRRLMNDLGIQSIIKKKFRVTTNSRHKLPVYPNLLNQDFKVSEPNKVWVGDITYIETREGTLYLAVVKDLYDKSIVGWSMGEKMDKELVMQALENAIKQRRPKAGLIMHTDKGSQYCSYAYQGLLREYGIISSMSGKGNCYDNACAESFFGTLKTEHIYPLKFKKFKTIDEARSYIFEYMEVFYNTKRLHSSLGYMSPKEFLEKENMGMNKKIKVMSNLKNNSSSCC